MVVLVVVAVDIVRAVLVVDRIGAALAVVIVVVVAAAAVPDAFVLEFVSQAPPCGREEQLLLVARVRQVQLPVEHVQRLRHPAGVVAVGTVAVLVLAVATSSGVVVAVDGQPNCTPHYKQRLRGSSPRVRSARANDMPMGGGGTKP